MKIAIVLAAIVSCASSLFDKSIRVTDSAIDFDVLTYKPTFSNSVCRNNKCISGSKEQLEACLAKLIHDGCDEPSSITVEITKRNVTAYAYKNAYGDNMSVPILMISQSLFHFPDSGPWETMLTGVNYSVNLNGPFVVNLMPFGTTFEKLIAASMSTVIRSPEGNEKGLSKPLTFETDKMHWLAYVVFVTTPFHYNTTLYFTMKPKAV